MFIDTKYGQPTPNETPPPPLYPTLPVLRFLLLLNLLCLLQPWILRLRRLGHLTQDPFLPSGSPSVALVLVQARLQATGIIGKYITALQRWKMRSTLGLNVERGGYGGRRDCR
ncbi:hypothetical protein M407DRAFT_151266 [Tulasnella calospora MUT 4182]|uniref:Uncharacterized protein n=1 Tax=Tulasnella calospora MUT 4182 TaxID=1051891 RepID=A0A0C3QWG6_9AGAM|nr:hypothetical protein M407DRAFT_151266 [Tulasnella calospora MUT 4182]